MVASTSLNSRDAIAPSRFDRLWFGRFANLLATLCGVSIFAVPWGFSLAGSLGGTIVVVFISYICYETIRILLIVQADLYTTTGIVASYPTLVATYLGESWEPVVKIATITSCIGGCIGYLIFLGEISGRVFHMTHTITIICAVVPLTYLCWLRNYSELEKYISMSCVLFVVILIYILYDGASHPNAQEFQSLPPAEQVPPLFTSFSSFCKFLGPATFMDCVHYMILSMSEEALRVHKSRQPALATLMEVEEGPQGSFGAIATPSGMAGVARGAGDRCSSSGSRTRKEEELLNQRFITS